MKSFAKITALVVAVTLFSGCVAKVDTNTASPGSSDESENMSFIEKYEKGRTKNIANDVIKSITLVCIEGVTYMRYPDYKGSSLTVKIDSKTLLPQRCTDSISINEEYQAHLEASKK